MSDLTIEVKNDAMLGRLNEKELHLTLIEQQKEIERLNNIIKEAKEFIKENTKWYDELLGLVEMHGYNTDRIPIVYVDKLLEILDKGE